jgi:hypothetical protein
VVFTAVTILGDVPNSHDGDANKKEDGVHGGFTMASLTLASHLAVKDYAGAWHAYRGRCFRFVYTSEDDGRSMVCPRSCGDLRLATERAWPLVRCERLHTAHLAARRASYAFTPL